MQSERLKAAVEYSKAYKLNKIRQRIVSGLCAIAVFVTTYALILPAITQEKPTYCGITAHTHGVDCKDGCEIPEHIHSGPCYIDSESLFESQAQIEASLPKTLSGIWEQDVVKIAESQIGYRESLTNVNPQTGTGYTRYGAWNGSPYGNWSTVFAAFCLDYAGVDKEYFPVSPNAQDWVQEIKSLKLLETTPEAGSIVFFRRGDKPDANRAAIISDVIYDGDAPVRIKVIEGDYADSVAVNEYSVEDESIYGYADLGNAFAKYEKVQPIIKVYQDENVTVKATCTADSGIPRDAILSVTVIDRESNPDEFEKSYETAFTMLEQANGEIKQTAITAFRLYDIHFESDGVEIQPDDTVKMEISYSASAYYEEAEVSVFHYKENEAEMPKSEHRLDDSGKIVTEFSTESFSLFAVVTSVSEVKSFVTLSKTNITSSNVSSLSGTYAIITNGYALNVVNGELTTSKAAIQASATTAEESTVRWKFTRSGSGYYISTTEEGVTYYLYVSGSDVILSSDTSQRTLFTATRSNTSLTLRSGNNYLNLSQAGVRLSSSQVLNLYTLPTGEFTVIFDGQLGKAAYTGTNTVYKYGAAEKVTTKTSGGYVTLPTPEETKLPVGYPTRLNGWYDIINNIYYDSSMFGASVKITANTTFYAEWVPESYDIGQNKNVVTNQPDTSGFVNTYVYDYTELFNVHSSYYDSSNSRWVYDTENGTGVLFNDWVSTGTIGNVYSKSTEIDGVSINVEKTNGQRGNTLNFPGTITAGIATNERIEALFGDSPMLGRINVGEADWLYSYDPDSGYYYYNSARHAAAYNQSEQRFYVYNHYEKIDNGNSLHDFLPFNYTDYTGSEIEYAEKNNGANYWFGMKSEITFYLPHDSGVDGGNKTAFGDDLQFRFSGDDDVWVFVDGKLVLDMGGMHDVVYGEINFSTGEVRTGQAISGSNIAANSAATRDEIPGLTGKNGITTTTLDTIKGGEEHTLTVYYLERGSSLSNCTIYFNLSPIYQLSLSKEDKEGNKLLEGAVFEVYSDEECTTPATLYSREEDGSFTVLDSSKFATDENGIATCWGLFAGKTYYVKEIVSPPGYTDMSEYVIEFSLSGDGKSMFIMIDSNGTGWEFVGQYVYSGGENHLIELHVYNDKFIGGDGELHVEKTWNDSGGANRPEEITVRLYANGEKTSRILVLSEKNGWKGDFYELPEKDADGNKYVYTVVEEDSHGYIVEYSKTEFSETIVLPEVEEWTSASTSLISGQTYRFVYNGRAIAVNGTALTMATVNDADLNQRWVATGSGSTWQFKNVGTGRYMKLNRSNVATDTNSTNVTYSQGKFQYSSTRRMYVSGSSLTVGTGSATTFTVETVTKYTPTETIKNEGILVTNTPIESATIPIQKIWDSLISDAERVEVEIDLYLVTIGSESQPTKVSSLTLNAENGWKATFDDLDFPEDGSYYVIVERTDSFLPKYSGTNTTLRIDGQEKTAHRVEFDSSGTAETVSVTNTALILLPETGGNGARLLFSIAITLLFCSVLHIIKSKKYEVKNEKL